MNNKEIADRLRKLPLSYGNPYLAAEVNKLADEVDPPRPEPGTVVQFISSGNFGIIGFDGIIYTMNGHTAMPADYKPARILAPDEVAVKIPSVRLWPEEAVALEGAYHSNGDMIGWCDELFVTRSEAECMEAER